MTALALVVISGGHLAARGTRWRVLLRRAGMLVHGLAVCHGEVNGGVPAAPGDRHLAAAITPERAPSADPN